MWGQLVETWAIYCPEINGNCFTHTGEGEANIGSEICKAYVIYHLAGRYYCNFTVLINDRHGILR